MMGLIGQSLGNWRVRRLLGEGAFGAVFEAEHTSIPGRFGAVKVLRPELTLQTGLTQRFLNEASAASRAEHENIVQIFDGGVTPDGVFYSVMELLRGTVLTDLIRQGRMHPQRAVNIVVQIAGALQAAHAIHVVHRDLKPDNVFITQRATNPEFVKVLDFGVAKLRGEVHGDAKLTSTGMIIGTAAYMSPEQWMGQADVDGRSDIYSLGVILYECLTGERPFSGTTPYEWIVQHMEAPRPDCTRFGVSPPLARFVQRMLARQPEERPQTMAQVIDELRQVATDRPPAGAAGAERMLQPGQQPTQVASYQQPTQVAGYQPPQWTPYQGQNAPGAAYPQPYAQPSAMILGLPRPLAMKLGEFALGAVILIGYIITHWGETITWIKNLFSLGH